MHTKLISPITLLFQVMRDEDGIPTFDMAALNAPGAFFTLSKTRKSKLVSEPANARSSTSFELYLRRMLSRCALQIHLPNPGKDLVASRQIKSLLPPTLRKTISFVDRFDSHWNSVVAYVKPIARSLREDPNVSHLTWKLYLLVLATKYGAEVVLPPKELLTLIKTISNSTDLNAEARARLAVLEGIVGSFSRTIETQALRFLPNIPPFAISERIAEILEDAYLLEASHLRRLLGLRENIAAIQRDLRKLLSLIQRRRPWAKGILGLGSDLIVGAHVPLAFLDKITEMAPELRDGGSFPILSHADTFLARKNESTFQFWRTVSGRSVLLIDAEGETNKVRFGRVNFTSQE